MVALNRKNYQPSSYGPSEILTGRSGQPSTDISQNETFQSDKFGNEQRNTEDRVFLDSEITSCPSVGQFDTDIESVPPRLEFLVEI